MTLLLTFQVKNILCYIFTWFQPAHAKHVLLYMTMVSDHIIFDVVYIVNLFDVQTGEFAHNNRALEHCSDKDAITYLKYSKWYLKTNYPIFYSFHLNHH